MKEQLETYEIINLAQLKELIEKGDHYIILDVRSKEEYQEGHVPHSINLPLNMIKQEMIGNLVLNLDTLIVVYCRSGQRSLEASKILQSFGYRNIKDFQILSNWI